ncbi:MAG TPA: hypothetical protein VFU21_23870 [Kofleriaceae bacterium]|nr:hypothetical protein [Kofleriaceae bacterium]
MRPVHWPSRTAICLDCRTALPDGAPCPAGHGRVAPIGGDGRERLLTEVWGPPPVRQRLRGMARAGAASGGFGTALDGCGACDLVGVDLGEMLVVLVFFVAAGAILWCIGAAIAALIRWWRGRLPPPRGAALPGAASGPPTGRTGVVLATRGLASDPLGGSSCVGFAAALEHRSSWRRRPATLLRDGATIGFDVLLDTGERVAVPPGPLLIDLARAPARRIDPGRLALYLGEIDPARESADDLDPFLCNLSRGAQLRPGDRVEVLGGLRAALSVTNAAGAGSYRDPAPTVLVPTGVPLLRRAV